MTSAASSISQCAALEAMLTDPKESVEIRDMVFTFRKRRNRALELLKEIPDIILHNPKGAFYIFPDISFYFGKSYNGSLIRNANDLSIYLLETAHVAVVPGDAFGDPNCIRISYATSMELLEEAIHRIKSAFAQLH